MRHSSLVALGIAAVAASLLLTRCGGSSESGNGAGTTTAAATTGSSSGKKAVTDEACNTLRNLVSDLALLDAGQGFDYVEDAADMGNFADTVQVPDAYGDSVKKVRDFVDDFASAAKDVGLEPNDAPTPDQADKLKSKLHLPDKGLTRALQTLAVWTGNLCPS
jgi:hypothetical protein